MSSRACNSTRQPGRKLRLFPRRACPRAELLGGDLPDAVGGRSARGRRPHAVQPSRRRARLQFLRFALSTAAGPSLPRSDGHAEFPHLPRSPPHSEAQAEEHNMNTSKWEGNAGRQEGDTGSRFAAIRPKGEARRGPNEIDIRTNISGGRRFRVA